jgi:mono/diheme cytochrome c family protein
VQVSRLALVRRRALILVACGLVLAGCSGAKTVSPTPQTVQGTLPKPTEVKGDPAAGKTVFNGTGGCAGCHTFGPAGSHGTVGPNLDHLAADAQKANQGPLATYVEESLTNPDGYIVPGFSKGLMSASCCSQLSQQQIADLVAFLTQKS